MLGVPNVINGQKTEKGHCCVFPFRYKTTTYNSCTKAVSIRVLYIYYSYTTITEVDRVNEKCFLQICHIICYKKVWLPLLFSWSVSTKGEVNVGIFTEVPSMVGY